MEQTDHDISILIRESAKGDAESCRKLYELLVDKVFAYVRYRTGTREQATDITQDVFIDFFTTLSNFTYQSRAQFYAYVFVITRRKLAKQYADMAVRSTRESAMIEEHTLVDQTPSVGDEARNDVAAALAALDDVTREIVVLYHWARYAFGEIALLVGMTESAVRVRHHRALKVLRKQLQEVET